MKNNICLIIILLAAFPRVVSSQEARQVRPLDNQLQLEVSTDLASVENLTTATTVPVKFTVKNPSKCSIGVMHVMENFRANVGISLAAGVGKPDKLFPLPSSFGGSAKWIAPGETIHFTVDVPIQLFKMKGEKFIAQIHYFGPGIGNDFEGDAFSKPFQFPSVE